MSCSWCHASIPNDAKDICVDVGRWDYLHTRWQISYELVCSEACKKALHSSNANYVAQVEYELKHQDQIAKSYVFNKWVVSCVICRAQTSLRCQSGTSQKCLGSTKIIIMCPNCAIESQPHWEEYIKIMNDLLKNWFRAAWQSMAVHQERTYLAEAWIFPHELNHIWLSFLYPPYIILEKQPNP